MVAVSADLVGAEPARGVSIAGYVEDVEVISGSDVLLEALAVSVDAA